MAFPKALTSIPESLSGLVAWWRAVRLVLGPPLAAARFAPIGTVPDVMERVRRLGVPWGREDLRVGGDRAHPYSPHQEVFVSRSFRHLAGELWEAPFVSASYAAPRHPETRERVGLDLCAGQVIALILVESFGNRFA